MAVIKTNIYSRVLKHGMDCYVLFPDSASKENKLKTVWIYHGGSGDHTGWLYNTKIMEYVNTHGFAAVIPNAHESCLVDMHSGPEYGRYTGEELPAMIWNMFPVLSDKREDNYLCGFSNGGYGVLHIGLKYNQSFGSIGAFSAGDKADAVFENDGSIKAMNRINLFGDGDISNTEYSIKNQARILAAEDTVRPEIYHACGSEDPWLDMNLILKKCFEDLGDSYSYMYDQIEGAGHDWKFWEEELLRYLSYTGLIQIKN